jgi:hypothetical protein
MDHSLVFKMISATVLYIIAPTKQASKVMVTNAGKAETEVKRGLSFSGYFFLEYISVGKYIACYLIEE